MFSPAFDTMFGFVGVFYSVVVPLIIIQLIILFFIPSLLKGGVNVMEVGKATYCYLAQAVGLILMTLGGLPTLYSVLAGNALYDTQYISLLFVFSFGGLSYLWHDHLARSVDKNARLVPSTVYFFTVRFIGHLIVLFASLSLLLKLMLAPNLAPGWWVMHTVVFVYGVLLWWCTSFDHLGKDLFNAPAILDDSSKKLLAGVVYWGGKKKRKKRGK